jgi:F0F1-type ATP synthase assembly protein I
VGLSFVFAMVIGAWSGRVLDGWLGTGPLFFIVLFFLGLAAGILNVYRTVSRAFPSSAPRGAAPANTPPASVPDDDLRPSDE